MSDETDDKVHWPAWYYGPDDAAEVFNSEDEVPEGWHDHPSKVGGAKKAKADAPVPVDSPYKDWDDARIVAELKTRKIEFGARWPRVKHEALLIADDKKKAK